MKKTLLTFSFIIAASTLFAGCNKADPAASGLTASPSVSTTASPASSISPGETAQPNTPIATTDAPKSSSAPSNAASAIESPNANEKPDTAQVIAKPDSITVLVNKQFALPENYEPSDLVYPNVPFTFTEKVDKRKMRSVAAKALEKLFAGAKTDGIALAGVSAYRSYDTQKALFNRYVQQDGEAKARAYSAVPGTSEHETGLAIDVSGSNGKCAAEDCFAGTKEAVWLGKHAAEYGFIIRYPKGKEAITGYNYEPWHLRYVGTDISQEIAAKHTTLENYLNAVPVSK
jgi:D-alanyl-D-alanine carboxypeptidase